MSRAAWTWYSSLHYFVSWHLWTPFETSLIEDDKDLKVDVMAVASCTELHSAIRKKMDPFSSLIKKRSYSYLERIFHSWYFCQSCAMELTSVNTSPSHFTNNNCAWQSVSMRSAHYELFSELDCLFALPSEDMASLLLPRPYFPPLFPSSGRVVYILSVAPGPGSNCTNSRPYLCQVCFHRQWKLLDNCCHLSIKR